MNISKNQYREVNVLEGFNRNCAPKCGIENCFAYADGKCRVLTDNRFKHGCPFYKDKKKRQWRTRGAGSATKSNPNNI